MVAAVKLNLPEAVPEWVSDPLSVNKDKPPKGIQVPGSEPGFALPVEWISWLQNTNYSWCKRMASKTLMNWHEKTGIAASSPLRAVAFHPNAGYWLVADSSGNTYSSIDGETWSLAGFALPSAMLIGTEVAIDTTRYIFPNQSVLCHTISPGVNWTTIASGTIGGTGNINAVCTKYPDSDFAVLCRGAGTALSVRRATSGITGSWSASSTQPPSVPTGAYAQALVYAGGTDWLLLVKQTSEASTMLYRSNDDGDEWAAVTGFTTPIDNRGALYMAFNRTEKRLVVVGLTATKEYLAYSDDLGDNWTLPAIHAGASKTLLELTYVYYCGGSVWVASGEVTAPVGRKIMLVSTDNGTNWRHADFHGAIIPSVAFIGCDGRKMMSFNDSTDYMRTDAI